MRDPAQALRRGYGIARSLMIYRGQIWKQRRERALYATFIKPGDLCFDIGAHVGDRTGHFLALGARVVALEPQPAAMAVLQRWYGRDPRVTLVEAAAGAASDRSAQPHGGEPLRRVDASGRREPRLCLGSLARAPSGGGHHPRRADR